MAAASTQRGESIPAFRYLVMTNRVECMHAQQCDVRQSEVREIQRANEECTPKYYHFGKIKIGAHSRLFAAGNPQPLPSPRLPLTLPLTIHLSSSSQLALSSASTSLTPHTAPPPSGPNPLCHSAESKNVSAVWPPGQHPLLPVGGGVRPEAPLPLGITRRRRGKSRGSGSTSWRGLWGRGVSAK